MCDHLLRGAGLANTGLPGEQHDTGLPGNRTRQCRLQGVKLALPSDETANVFHFPASPSAVGLS